MTKPFSARCRTKDLVSAGGVVYRQVDDRIEIILCGRDVDGTWGLPKGRVDTGESLEETALREVREETGLEVQLVEKIGVIDYWFSLPDTGIRCHKYVHHYLMMVTGGNISDHDWEYDRVEWFPVEKSLRTLTHKNEVEILARARSIIGRGVS